MFMADNNSVREGSYVRDYCWNRFGMIELNLDIITSSKLYTKRNILY